MHPCCPAHPHPLPPASSHRPYHLSALVALTGNKKKLEEVVAILEAGHPLPFAVQPAALDLPELQVGGWAVKQCFCANRAHNNLQAGAVASKHTRYSCAADLLPHLASMPAVAAAGRARGNCRRKMPPGGAALGRGRCASARLQGMQSARS